MQTQNMDANPKCKPENKRNYRKTFASQRNIMTCQDMSHTCHMRHICMPGDQTTKNNFAHETIY